MSETIPTIDDWNARLAPPAPVDSNASDSSWPETGDCGCCPMPKCCPPQLECRSGTAYVQKVGHLMFGESVASSENQWERTRYLRFYTHVIGDNQTTESEYWDANTLTWVTFTINSVSASHYQKYGTEYSQGLSGALSGASGICINDPAVLTDYCEIGGVRTEEDHAIVNDGGSYYDYVSHRETRTYSSAEGEETAEHAAWQIEADAWTALYTNQAGFEAAHAAWQSAYDTYDAWAIARDAWVNEDPDNRSPEDYPEPEPPAPGAEPQPLTEEPTEFYGPCDIKCVVVDTWWEWNYTTHSADESDSNTYTVYGEGSFLGPSHSTPAYETPVTHEEFIASAMTWMETHRESLFSQFDASDSSPCAPGTACDAQRDAGSTDGTDYYVSERFFRHRWKLNKCCGLYAALSWLKVFYPQSFLNWLAQAQTASDYAAPPVMPTTTDQSWEWEGTTRPTECDNSDSSDSVIGPNDPGWNAFDDETRWSPWSLTVAVPSGEYGRVMLRNLLMACYRSIYGTKPDRIPLYGTYDPSDLDENGIRDSQQ